MTERQPRRRGISGGESTLLTTSSAIRDQLPFECYWLPSETNNTGERGASREWERHLTADGRGFSRLVIDTVGGEVLEASYGLLRAGGRLVTLGAPPSEDKAREFGVHAMFFVVTPDPGELARLAGLADDGRLRTVVSQTFPLHDGRCAFDSARRPRPPGKTVLIAR